MLSNSFMCFHLRLSEMCANVVLVAIPCNLQIIAHVSINIELWCYSLAFSELFWKIKSLWRPKMRVQIYLEKQTEVCVLIFWFWKPIGAGFILALSAFHYSSENNLFLFFFFLIEWMNAFCHIETQNYQEKKKKKGMKMSELQSSWTLKMAEVQEVSCILQLSWQY